MTNPKHTDTSRSGDLGWQPIETFPGDHPFRTYDYDRKEPKTRHYDAALVYGPTWAGDWQSYPQDCTEDHWTGAAQIAIASTWQGRGFWEIQPSIQDYQEYIKPTHWMPLPHPPKDHP